jgi:hypothetical protein
MHGQGIRPASPITPELVQIAFDWLNESSDHVAAKRVALMHANRLRDRVEEKCKRVHAGLCRHGEGSVEARKWAATCHENYTKAQAELDKAEEEVAVRVGEWEAVTDQREKCKMIIEAWRSQQANERYMGNFR